QRATALHLGLNYQLFLGDIRIIAYLPKTGGRSKLQPHRLPDSGCPGVKTAIRSVPVALFSAGLKETARIIPRKHGQMIFSLVHQIADLQREGSVSSLMPACFTPVDKYPALVVHRAEVKPDAAVKFFFFHRKGAMIPHSGNEIPEANTAQAAFRTKRNDNFLI